MLDWQAIVAFAFENRHSGRRDAKRWDRGYDRKYDDLRFLRLYDHAIDRVAVVCDRFWKDTWVGIFSLFSGIRTTFFETSQIEAVTRWIQAG